MRGVSPTDSAPSQSPNPKPGSAARLAALVLLTSFVLTGAWLVMRGPSGGPSFAQWTYPGSTLTTNTQSGRYSSGCFLSPDSFDKVSKYYEQGLFDLKNAGDPMFMSRSRLFGGLVCLAKVSATAKDPQRHRIYLRRIKRELILVQLSSASPSDGTAIRLTSVFFDKPKALRPANDLRQRLEYPGATSHAGGSAATLTGFHYSTTDNPDTVWNHYRQTLDWASPADSAPPTPQAQPWGKATTALLPALKIAKSDERTLIHFTSNSVATVSCYGRLEDGQTHMIITAVAP